MRLLAVGDSFLTADVMRRGLARLDGRVALELVQLDERRTFVPATPSERRIRESAGTPDQVIERLAQVEILLVHGAPVTEEVLAGGGALRLVGCARGGPTNVDLEAASRRGIPVVTTPGKNAEAVADQTLALIVMLARGFRRAMGRVESGAQTGQSAFEGADLMGHELGGKLLGLVGYGQVGRRVAVRAAAFGMRVLAYDPFVSPGPDDVAEAAAGLDELLALSDFVSLHARATAENDGLIGTVALARMKSGAMLVNTARASLVDEAALDVALASGQLAGAALDVVRPLAPGKTQPLLRHQNVVVLPHIGGATHETVLRGVTMLAEAVECLLEDRALPNLATPTPERAA